MSTNRIKAIIFDYFGVISSDEYWRFVKEDKNVSGEFHELASGVNLGKIHWDEFLKIVADKTAKPVEEVKRMYESELIQPNMVSLINKLHTMYKTALLSNAHHEFMDPIIEETHLKDLFDVIVISSQVGMTKPDPMIFHYTLKQLGAEPKEAVFIDDQTRHCEAARALGIKTILYRNFDQATRELQKILTNTDH